MPSLPKPLARTVKRAEAARRAPLSNAAITAFAARVRPHFGKVNYRPPPSYRALLRAYGPIEYLVGDDEGSGFRLLGPKAVVADTRDLVHVPRGVEWEDAAGQPVVISTNHLVAFAEWLPASEERWCFDLEAETTDGELPVYLHDQDEPRCAKDVKTGRWVEPKARKPRYENFTAWLVAAVADYEKRRKRLR